jgi:hypothetical protein
VQRKISEASRRFYFRKNGYIRMLENPAIKRSAPSPLHTACNCPVHYYVPPIAIDEAELLLNVPKTRLELLSGPVFAAICIITQWSMRSIEYLRATTDDLLGNDMLLIRGAKGSAAYRIHCPGIDSQTGTWSFNRHGWLISGISYHKLWQACKRHDIGFLPDGHKNIARTHAARYNLVKAVGQRGQRIAGDLLHHRSQTAIKYYTDARG